jgi:hypothetical protein
MLRDTVGMLAERSLEGATSSGSARGLRLRGSGSVEGLDVVTGLLRSVNISDLVLPVIAATLKGLVLYMDPMELLSAMTGQVLNALALVIKIPAAMIKVAAELVMGLFKGLKWMVALLDRLAELLKKTAKKLIGV